MGVVDVRPVRLENVSTPSSVLASLLALGCVLPVSADERGAHYPASALEDGIEGWVELSYWVDDACKFRVEVVAADPEGVLDAVALDRLVALHVNDEEEIDWAVVGYTPPTLAEGEALSQSEYARLKADVDAKGPWPVQRTITGFPEGRVQCDFASDGALVAMQVLTPDGERVSSDESVVGKQQSRMRFIMED